MKSTQKNHLYSLIGIVMFMAIIQIVSFSPVKALGNTEPTAKTLLHITNDEREQKQLKPLAENNALASAAASKAQDMVTHQYWAHVAPDGSTPWRWFKEAGYNYSYAGENLAKNFHTPETVMAAWMTSPEHQANILNKHYSEVGFASVDGRINGQPVTLTVALYGAPAAVTMASAITSTKEASTFVGSQTSIMERFSATARMGLTVLLSVAILLIVAIITYIHRKKDV